MLFKDGNNFKIFIKKEKIVVHFTILQFRRKMIVSHKKLIRYEVRYFYEDLFEKYVCLLLQILKTLMKHMFY